MFNVGCLCMCNKNVGIDVASQEALSINKPVY